MTDHELMGLALDEARKAAALRPAKTGLLQNLFGRNKK